MADKSEVVDRSEIEDLPLGGSNDGVSIDVKLEAQEIDPVLEKKLLRKCDLHLVPMLFILFLCAFIDRINIGNARIQGLEKDLHMSGVDYNIALFMFFVPYILLEVPSNMILKRIRPSIFLPCIMILWGILTICQGLTKSFAGLVICRVIIGALEAGFFPGCLYLLSMYYRRHELQWRFNLFFSASVIAGAFSGLLAYGIAHMDGIAGYGGWAWIFIIEGIFTVVVAVIALFVVPDWPENAKFLKNDERDLLLRRLRMDVEEATMNHWDKKTAKRIFSDVKMYLGILMYLGVVTTGYAGAFFTPTILKQLGWTSIRAQVMSIPIYVFAMICTISSAILSDRLRHRFGFVVFGCLLATIGYVILLNMHKVVVGARYFALFAIIGGGFTAQPATLVWVQNNVSGHYKRSISSAMMIGWGNTGGIVASNMFITSQAPEYPLGFGLGLALIWVCVISSTVYLFYVRRENKLREEGRRDHRYNLPEEEKRNLGDDHPVFRFTY
ncbi:MFS general substrate transporter, partial [Aureobasidium melanogenum]